MIMRDDDGHRHAAPTTKVVTITCDQGSVYIASAKNAVQTKGNKVSRSTP